MNLQAHSVSGTVKKSLHPTVATARLKTRLVEIVLDQLMDVTTPDTRIDLFERHFLCVLNRMELGLQPFAGLAFHDGARDVTPVPGTLRARENIQDNGLVCF